jgi:hypothetical protein
MSGVRARSGADERTPLRGSRSNTRLVLPSAVYASSLRLSPLRFEPDTKYDYNNTGINTEGQISEVISGMLYQESP